MFRVWWCGAGLNRRHKDFQSFALPTELPHRVLRSLGEGGLLPISNSNFSIFRLFKLCFQRLSSAFAEPAKIRVFMNSPKALKPL
jgi:hypothetical protein